MADRQTPTAILESVNVTAAIVESIFARFPELSAQKELAQTSERTLETAANGKTTDIPQLPTTLRKVFNPQTA